MASEHDRSEALEAYRRFALGEVALELGRPDESLERWPEAHDEVTSSTGRTADDGNRSKGRDAATLTALGLMALFRDEEAPVTVDEQLECFEMLVQAIEHDRPVPVGAVLDRFFRGLRRVNLSTQNAPFPRTRPGCTEWVDLALDAPRSPVQFIPVSVFTRRYFRQELPKVVAADAFELEPEVDSFRYHRENDKALYLRERFSEFAESPISFQYFIDSSGLTEIVIDSKSLGWRESTFAAALFCRYNGIPDAMLDGSPVPTFGIL